MSQILAPNMRQAACLVVEDKAIAGPAAASTFQSRRNISAPVKGNANANGFISLASFS